jgi:hypothetical protein
MNLKYNKINIYNHLRTKIFTESLYECRTAGKRFPADSFITF